MHPIVIKEIFESKRELQIVLVMYLTQFVDTDERNSYTRYMEPQDLLRIFFQSYPEIKYKKGKCLLAGDQDPDGMSYLVSGFVRQVAKKNNGDLMYMHIYKPTSCFPLMWLFNDTHNRYYYEAMTDVVIRKAPAKDVRKFLSRQPVIVEEYTSRLLLGIDGLLVRMESLVLDDAYAKTVLLFWYFATTFGKKEGKRIVIAVPMCQREISNWIGTTRETASLMTEKLRGKGILSYRGKHYEIASPTALEKEVERVKNI